MHNDKQATPLPDADLDAAAGGAKDNMLWNHNCPSCGHTWQSKQIENLCPKCGKGHCGNTFSKFQ